MASIEENTNRAIFKNALFLYLRLFITAVSGLFITRFALQSLGINDYGLYSVVGSIVSFISIINTMMLSTSNRFIAIAIGKNDIVLINETFNVNLIIHVCCAIIVTILGLTLGDYYIRNFVNYNGNIEIAVKVFNISIIAAAISFIGVPFNGLLMAKERFNVFCLIDIIIYPIRLFLCYILIKLPDHRLLAYTIISSVFTIIPTCLYYRYCSKYFADIIRLKLVKGLRKYKEVLKFSVWVGYGALAQVGKTQGASLLINAFFTTIMNTALGIANQLNSFILLFIQNISKPISPQITKSYSIGDYSRCKSLMIASSKLSFMLMLLVSTPFFIIPEFILTLWLGTIPPYSVLFIRLLIINSLIDALNLGISEYVFASGQIIKYQIITNTLLLTSIIGGYVVLTKGFEAYSLLIVYIIFSILAVIARQLIIHFEHGFDIITLFRKSYLPSLMVSVLSCPLFLLRGKMPDFLLLFVSVIYVVTLIVIFGITKNEKTMIISYIKGKR